MHTNDQTADAVHDADGVDGQTTTDSPGGIDDSSGALDIAPSGAGTHPMPNEIVLEALTERAIVRVEVDGEIGLDGLRDAEEAVYADDIVISRIDGRGERDRFQFTGTMVDLEIVEGDVEVAVELHRDDPVARGRPSGLSVHAQGSEVDYRFAVSGVVEPASGAEPGASDGTPGKTASGTVTGSGVDEYQFTGEITEFETSTDEVLVLVNDQVVDAGALD